MADQSMTGDPGTDGPRRIGRRVVLAVAVAVLTAAVLVAGCGGSDVTQSGGTDSVPSAANDYGPATSISGNAVTIKAIDNDFDPKNITIAAGTKVTFENAGHNFHDVVPVDAGEPDFTVPQEKFAPGQSASFTFDKPGTYTYYCSLHATATAGSMRGKITVTG